MKTFVIFFTYLLCSFTITEASLLQPVYQNIHQEYETAIDVSKKFQKGILSKEQANEILISTFHDYSHPDGKLSTFTQFIKETVGIENPVIHANSEQRGWSGCDVYSVHIEENKEPQFFLKIFPYDSKDYLPEIFGLSFMNEIKEVDSPKICALGQSFINETLYFLVLETSLKGTSIQQYYNQVGQHPIGSKERKKAFLELCEAVKACGLGLAKLHTYLPSTKQPLPKDAEESINLTLNAAINELLHQPKEGIEIETLQIYTQHIIQKMKACDHDVGLAYDDVKTIHTLYDPINKRFSLVDPARLSLSFNQEGELQGLLIKDVYKYLLSLSLNRFAYFLDHNQNVYRKELLTEEEIKVVKNIFKIGYTKGGGVLPNSLEKEYVSLYHNLFFIKNSRRDFPEPELTRVRDLINISLENVKFQLSKFNS